MKALQLLGHATSSTYICMVDHNSTSSRTKSRCCACSTTREHNNPPPPPPRLLRWRLKMQQYKFSARYNPRKENPLETYSPHTQILQESTEQYVNFIAINAVKAITMEQLEEETRHDVTIQNAIEAKRQSNWHVIIESTTDDPSISTAQSSPFTSEVAGSILSENFLNVTRTQCSTHVKNVCQHSAESRGFSPGTPVSSHREVDRVG